MNTTPDEVKLALWLDDELQGEEFAAFDVWASSQAEHMAAREEIRSYRARLQQVVPAAESVPYPDFFNSRIARVIREERPAEAVPASARPKAFWTSWFMPVAACAGMAAAFWVGSLTQRPQGAMAQSSASEPYVYTPDNDIRASWFSSDRASVIVLDGVAAIPDSTDFTVTAYLPHEREIDSTAGREHFPAQNK